MKPRAVVKNIETKVKFTNEELIQILQEAAGAPEGASGSIFCEGDSFYGDLEIVWWEQQKSGAEE